jgi:hypothetical protein
MSKKTIHEITSTNGSGVYKVPLNLAPRIWKRENMGAFTEPVSKYLSPELAYDDYDGEMERKPKEIKKLENKAKKMANIAKRAFSQNDVDGNPINGYSPQGSNVSGTPDYIYKQANLPKIDFKPILKEDLAVWFGKKKKKKGSSQPQGPWVNICRKKEGGGHPPCGRPDADPKGYPKCRAAGVASKMTDSQKKSACAQKRKAEKSDTQSGKGQKPVMTSYKPKNESLRETILEILRKSFT